MKVIVSTRIVELYGNTYREITFHDGEKQLARYHPKHNAYFGDIRTLISETSGQHIGMIRTAYRKHSDTFGHLAWLTT